MAVFSSDPPWSAYATSEIVRRLALAGLIGAAAFRSTIPTAGVIAVLLLIAVYSHHQTILFYPKEGGACIVATTTRDSIRGWWLRGNRAARACEDGDGQADRPSSRPRDVPVSPVQAHSLRVINRYKPS